MEYTTSRVHGMYRFSTKEGKSYQTLYSPKQCANQYCFDAVDERNNLKVILSKDVNYESFEYEQYKKR